VDAQQLHRGCWDAAGALPSHPLPLLRLLPLLLPASAVLLLLPRAGRHSPVQLHVQAHRPTVR